jgi:hypothetical protein
MMGGMTPPQQGGYKVKLYIPLVKSRVAYEIEVTVTLLYALCFRGSIVINGIPSESMIQVYTENLEERCSSEV